MFKPLELFIGLRYTRAKRRNHFISFISLASMAGIALGVMALITVLSVMNGFEQQLRARILGVVSHATVQGSGGAGIRDWQALRQQLEHYPGISGSAPYIQAEGLLSQGQRTHGVLVRAVEPALEHQVSDLAQRVIAGRFDSLTPGSYHIVLGAELAYALGVSVGDSVTLITPQATLSPVGILPRLKRFTVTGIVEIGMYEYDSGLAIMHLDDARVLFRTGDEVSGLRLKLQDLFKAAELTEGLQQRLPPGYQAVDWTTQHANFFRAVRMEKMVMFVILLLIVAVAAFNLVSSLVMMVTDKQSDIAILRTLGASPASIMGIFVVQGTIVGVIGTVLGVIGGVLLASNIETLVPALEQLLGFKFLAPDVYYISDLPSDMRWRDVGNITVAALLMCLLATLYPAWRASRTQPAEALRYE
ncbi:MAG: lipoprotein-releasing ABC transporter permease subunit [Gammaproteobacteria bacterium]|nr:lipoprotein-releasing ABC transporter permease subunit [Gammaproteobacteria bacterium]